MNKKLTLVLFVIVIIILGGISLGIFYSRLPGHNPTTENTGRFSFTDGTYIIDGQKIILKDGLSEIEIASSSSKIITRYFGNEIKHDLDNDGREDLAFVLTQETGGSGIFYYVVAKLNTINGPKGSEAFFIGDRIAPQTTELDEGKTANGTNRRNVIVVNYMTRFPDESFSVQPSFGKSVWLKLDPVTMQFGEVAQNFEGESI